MCALVCKGCWNICVLVFIVVIKHQDQKQLKEERMCLILQLSGHIPSLREVRAGTWRQEPGSRNLEARTERNITEEFYIMHCNAVLSVLAFWYNTNNLKHGKTQRGFHTIIRVSTQGSSQQDVLYTISWSNVLNWGSFFSDYSKTCQDNITQSIIVRH